MVRDKKVLAVITARKGSKGIPGKNYRDLLGKPLFMWSVLASLLSDRVDLTVVSSDCPEIEKIVKEYKNKNKKSKLLFIKRPKNISGDLSKNEEALIHALRYFKSESKKEFKIIVNLQPTSPCRFSGLLDKCLDKYIEGNYKSLFTAKKYTPFFWQKINNKWEYMTGKNCFVRPMRQEIFEDDKDSDFLMHDNGSVYIIDSEVLLKTKCRISKNHIVYETTGVLNLQIDEEYDFDLIRSMCESRGINSLVDKDVDDEGVIITGNKDRGIEIVNEGQYINIGSNRYSRKDNEETETVKMKVGDKIVYSPKFKNK